MKIIKTANKTNINISKIDFLKIGFSTGWIEKYSTSEGIIEIDGKFYKDENGITIEVENPNNKIKEKKLPKTITIKNVTVPSFAIKEDFTFTEGESYENYYGVYEVKNINTDNNTIDVIYISIKQPSIFKNQTYNYPLIQQAEAVLSNKYRQQNDYQIAGLRGTLINPDFNVQRKKDEYFIIGYIAQNGYVSAEIGPHSIKTFPKQYEDVTGEDPEKYLNKGYHLSPSARYSYTLRIKIPSPTQLNTQSRFNNFSRLDSLITRGSSIEINSNEYIWKLFNIGLRIARNGHNVDNILNNVPEEYKEDFTAGAKAT